MFNVSRVVIGRKLKEARLRDPGGEPSAIAICHDMVEETEGPQPWIRVWLWHLEKTIPYLEQAGLRRVDHVSA